MRSLVALPLCALAMSFFAGCNPTLDQKALEGAISAKLKDGKYPLTSVSCPAAQPIKKDDTFACTAKFEGDTTATIDVKQDGTGNVEWDAKGILLVADFAKMVDKKTKESDPKAEVSCPGTVIVVKKDVTLKCSVKSEGGSQDYVVTFTDDKGAWDAKSAGGEPKPATAQADPPPARAAE